MTISFILIIGLILYVGVLSDSSGRLTIPAAGSIVYIAAVIATAAVLAYVDRKGKDMPRHPGGETGDKGSRNGIAE